MMRSHAVPSLREAIAAAGKRPLLVVIEGRMAILLPKYGDMSLETQMAYTQQMVADAFGETLVDIQQETETNKAESDTDATN